MLLEEIIHFFINRDKPAHPQKQGSLANDLIDEKNTKKPLTRRSSEKP